MKEQETRKNKSMCPFTHSPCSFCAIYRGRHYYAGFCGAHDKKEIDYRAFFFEFEDLKDLHGTKSEEELPNVRLRLIDMESGNTKICELQEARDWDFTTPDVIRMINGIQITSFDNLIRIIKFLKKYESGTVDIYEAPLFMLLAGG